MRRFLTTYPVRALLGLLLAISLAVGLLVTLTAADQARNAVLASAETASARTATVAAQEVSAELTQFRELLFTRALAVEKVASPAQCGTELGGIGLGASIPTHLDLLAASGDVLCSSDSHHATTYAGAPWLTRHGSGLTVDGAYHDPTVGWSVVLAQPLNDGNVLADFISDEPLAGTLHVLLSSTQPYEYVITSGGRSFVVSRSIDPARWAGRNVATTPFAQVDSPIRSDLSGTDRVYGRAAIPDAGWVPGTSWTLYTGITESFVLTGTEHAQQRDLLIILGGFLAMLAATLLVYRSVARPLRKLSQAVRSAAVSSNTALEVADEGPTEIRVLAEGLRSLVESVNTELSRREQAQELARRSEEAYRTLFEDNPLPMWVYDADSFEVMSVNQAAVELYGYSPEEFRTLQDRNIWVDDLPTDVLAALRSEQSIDNSGPWRHRTKQDTVIEVLVSSRVVTFQSRKAKLMMVTDVTDRLRLQRQINQSQRLDSLGELAGGVAHDFNNLLGVIINHAAFVREWVMAQAQQTARDGDELVLSDLNQIDLASNRAAELTRQLLAFARRETRSPRPLDLHAVVDEVQLLLSRSLGERVRLVAHLDRDVRPVVADVGQLEQVFINLAVNARDAMPSGGTITFEAHNETVRADSPLAAAVAPGPYVTLVVRDEGVGMPPEVLERAFEPFFTTKPAGSGTGLGLATIYGIVTATGGAISLESEVGRGTTVSIHLPATSDAVEASLVPPAVYPPPVPGTRVLVVEDEEAIRKITARMLTRNGYEVLLAGDGPEAIEISTAFDGPIDLLLTDVVMPTMLGSEIAEHIRSQRPGVCVVFMSGYARGALGPGQELAEGVILLEKPFREEELLRIVHDALARMGDGAEPS